MHTIRKIAPFLLFALFCVGIAASNHWKGGPDFGGVSPSRAKEVCSQTCQKFTQCVRGNLPPSISVQTFQAGCYSGCMDHVGTVDQCVREGEQSCEGIVKCSLDLHFKRKE